MAFDDDPASWSREMLVLRTPAVDQAVEAVGGVVVALFDDDVDAAQAALGSIDGVSVDRWYDDAVVAGHRRATILGDRRRQGPFRVGRSPVVDPHPDAVDQVLDRDDWRCRFCAVPLMNLGQMRLLWARLGRPSTSTGVPWTLVEASLYAVEGARRRFRRTEPDLVAVCRPCRLGLDGYTLEEVGLDDPRRLPRRSRPDWHPIVQAFQALATDGSTMYALVREATVLDGSTLDLIGDLIGDRVGTLGVPVDLRARVTSRNTSVDGHVECRRRGSRVSFHVHVDLLEAVRSDPAPRWQIELGDTHGVPVGIVARPGFDRTPNHEFMVPIPPVRGSGHRFRFATRDGLALDLRPLGNNWDVETVETDADELRIGLVTASCTSPIDEVWIEPRGANASEPGRVDLAPTPSGAWALRVDARMRHTDVPSAIWNVWVSWEHDGRRHQERPGRLSSDLIAQRQSVRFPTCAATIGDGVRITVAPYLAISRHLALKVTATGPAATPAESVEGSG